MESRIKAIREANNLNQSEMAERIGVTVASISAYETGIRKPSNTTMAVICEKFDLNESWLRTGEGEMKRKTPKTIIDDLARTYRLSPDAVRILQIIAQAFQRLTPEQAHEMVEIARRNLMDAADVQVVELPRFDMNDLREEEEEVDLIRFDSAAAAGAPNWVDGDNYTRVTYPASIVPKTAKFALVIAGHSMEPEISNGDTVFVEPTQDYEHGDILIVWVEGEGTVCKRAYKKRGKLLRLESVNRAYPDFEGTALDNARIYGKVVGKTTTPDLPEPVAPPPPTQLTPEEAGRRIHAARLGLKYSPEDVAAALQEATGERVAPAQVKAWEAGRWPVPDRLRAALEKLLYTKLSE